MKSILFILSSLILLACNPNSPKSTPNDLNMNQDYKSYLALGDSYTIGEGVSESERYPNLLVQRLNQNAEIQWRDPEIIAQTGWTVDELEAGINKAAPTGEPYDLVTLLIGVNNQYRGRSVAEYRTEFEQMLLRAIGFSGNLPDHVLVLSIPDWGVTPFAKEKGTDAEKVAGEIDAYNQAKQEICRQYGVKFIDITTNYRLIGGDPDAVVADQLHPSGAIYKQWAQALFEHIQSFNKP